MSMTLIIAGAVVTILIAALIAAMLVLRSSSPSGRDDVLGPVGGERPPSAPPAKRRVSRSRPSPGKLFDLGKKVFTRITVNGKTYSSLDEVPEHIRSMIADSASGGGSVRNVAVSESYDSLDEMPPEVRERFQKMIPDESRREGITIVINGETHHYASRDEVPPEFRELLE